MQIIISGRHMELPDDLKSYINEKAGKLPRYYDRILEINVVVMRDAGDHTVEMIAQADHHNRFVGTERHADPFACVDMVMDDLKRQLTRHKERHRNRMHE